MLNKNDFRSMWEIAFRWEGIEPPSDDKQDMPEGVIDKLDKLIWAFKRDRIALRYFPGNIVMREDLFEMLFMDWTMLRFNRCLVRKKFPHSLFANRFAYRADILKWCEDDYIEPPEFWTSIPQSLSSDSEEIGKESLASDYIGPEQKTFIASLVSGVFRHRNSKFDSMICQAIARTLWDQYPDMTIEDMKKHKAIQIYGNGRAYLGKNTLRDWLSEVDPRDPETKSGRKKRSSTS